VIGWNLKFKFISSFRVHFFLFCKKRTALNVQSTTKNNNIIKKRRKKKLVVGGVGGEVLEERSLYYISTHH
jgi:hypothetical protein